MPVESELSDKFPVTGQAPRLQRTNTVAIETSNYFTADSTSKKKEALRGRWTDEEHRLFLEGVLLFKKDWR